MPPKDYRTRCLRRLGQVPSGPEGVSFRYQTDWVNGRMQRMTDNLFIACELGTINDPNQVAWTAAVLSDLARGRWPKVNGFSCGIRPSRMTP